MLGNIISSFMDNIFAQKRQDDAQDFSAQQFATRYQTTVKDMAAAGLNPMLAYSSVGASAPSSSAASAGNSFSSGYAAYQQNKLAQEVTTAQVAKMESEKALVDEQKENLALDTAIKAKYGLSRAEAELNNVLSATGLNLEMQGKVITEAEKASQEILNLKTTRDQVVALINNLQEQNKLLQKQGLSEVQRAAMLSAQARYISAQAKMEEFDIDAVIKTGGIGRLARETKPVSDIASDWLSPGKWLDKFIPDKFKDRKVEHILRKEK